MSSLEEYRNQNIKYIKENKERFTKMFDVINRPGSAFSNILHFNVDNGNKYFQKKDFFKLLFTETASFKKVSDEILDNFKYENKFQILHSFAKNGKSTFLKHLQFKKERYIKKGLNLKFISFDFSENTNNNTSPQSSFQNTVHSFFESFLFDGDHIIEKNLEILYNLNEFISNNKFAPEDYESENKINDFKRLFSPFRRKLTLLIDTYNLDNTKFKEEKEQEFIDGFNKIINDLQVEKAGELFAYILLLRIIEEKNFFETKFIDLYSTDNNKKYTKTRNKLVVVLDNIDDISSHLASEVATNQAFYISKFMDIYFTFISEFSKHIKNFNLSEDVYFVYTYRTANYINAFQNYRRKYFLNESQKNRFSEYYYSARKHKITTVKESAQIIEKKFWFYQILCEVNNVNIHEKYSFFKHLHRLVYSPSSEIDLSQVFRLWNGNRTVIFNGSFFRQFDNFVFAPINKEFSFLEKGSLLHFFLRPFYDEGYYDTNLSKVITYIFSNFTICTSESKCEISRMILSIIINKLQDSNNKLRKIDNSFDLNNKGISIVELLDAIVIKNKFKNYAYELEEIKEFLNLLFFEEIDAWGHLLTCTKTTSYVENGINYQGKLLSFDKEIGEYKNAIESNNSLYMSNLKEIRFFYNDNALYLLKFVLPNFEYFSVFKGVKSPLMYLVDYELIEGTYKFEFEKVIADVYKSVKCISESSISFFKRFFLCNWSPKEYCSTELSFNNTFHFKEVISRHLTYIDQFRRYFINTVKDEDNLKNVQIAINNKLSDYLGQYITLYFTTHKEFGKMGGLPESLTNAFEIFEKLQKVLDEIKKEENILKNIPLDIETGYNKVYKK